MSNTYKAGLYLRLSREDDDKDAQSQSISNQEDFLRGYAIQNGYQIIDIYADDGYSGTNFDRPEFLKMLCDIEKGKINMVITKDLSRLGRDYIQTGHYLERYFPQNNIRYIAVNDGIDTFEEGSGGNDMSPFKAVINDMYAKDVSKKVRTALNTKKAKGEFIGSTPPYGYAKNPNNKNALVADNSTAPYVRQIYQMFLSGVNLLRIAKELTLQGVPTPSQAKGLTHTQKRFKGVWNEAIIRRILTSQTYIGHMTQNRIRKISYKVDKVKHLPENEWIVVENTHEPLVSKEDFEAVQKLLSKRSYHAANRKTNVQHLLTGVVFCADCDSPMSFVRESETRTYMMCRTWKSYAKLGLCTSHCIREDFVEEQILKVLRELAQKYINDEQIMVNCEKKTRQQNTTEQQKRDIEGKIAEVKATLLSLYKDKTKGIITERDFSEMSDELNAERERYTRQLAAIETKMTTNSKQSTMQDMVTQFLKFETIDRNALLLLIDKVYIYSDKSIAIQFSFTDPGNN